MDAVDFELFDRLCRYTGFGAADRDALRSALPSVRASFPTIVGVFYERLQADEATRRFLGDPVVVQRLTGTMTRWLEEFLHAPRDRAFVANRLRLAHAHTRIGLHQSFVIGAFSLIRTELGKAIAHAIQDLQLRDRATAAMHRALDLEVALLTQFHLEAERYRDLVESAPVMIHQLDRQGRIVLINRTELERLGYSHDEVLYRPLLEFVRESDRDAVRHHLERVFQEGHHRCEVALRAHNGAFVPVEIVATGVRDPLDGQVVRTRAYVRDLSDHKRVQQELHQEREMERRYLDTAGVMFVVLDRDGNVQMLNRRGCQLLKVSGEEVLGSNWFERFLPREHQAEVRGSFDRLIRGEVRVVEFYETPVVATDGEQRTIEWHNAVLTDEHGRVTGTLSSGTDITERRQLQRKLAEQSSLARLGEMAAVVAHEVRNPLAGISGALQIVQANLPANASDRDILSQVLARIDALDEKVEDLLMFARPRPPNRVAVSARALLQGTVTLFRADPRLTDVEVSLAGPDVALVADPELLKQVFLNLLMNAAQAMQSRGLIRIALESEHGECQVAVSDTGPGIPAALREKVFEPFFTTKHRGTGLGLPTARRIVEAHGGRIHFVCPAGGGTTFHVALPVVERREVERHSVHA